MGEQTNPAVAAADAMIRAATLPPGELMKKLGVPAEHIPPDAPMNATVAVDASAPEKLPSGKTFTMLPAKGRHLLAAQNQAEDTSDVMYLVLTQLVAVDGHALDLEGVLDLDDVDGTTLMGRLLGDGNKPEPGKLPSGHAYSVRPGKTRDLRDAQRLASTPHEVSFHLAAKYATVDGDVIVGEDVLEMPFLDVLTLLEATSPKVPTQAPSA